ncbi:hypothetical protein KASHIRA_01550 [Serratia phage vB_SmaM-Kashira]|nr:hypothetical protein KASHIRA_01550 [Serratia phage vB_SmaM-Kashira]
MTEEKKKKQKPRLKSKEDRAAHDLYETPKWCVDSILKIIPIRNDWSYMEPCRASGRFYNHMPIGSAWGEIRHGIDYLKTEYNIRVDCILTNPPFLLAQEFVEKAHKDADVVIMLLRLGFLESQRREEFWKQYPLNHLITLSRRPSFTEDGKTDGAGYGYFVWDPKGKLKDLKLPPFMWIS